MKEGYIKKFEIIEVDGFKSIHITLKYGKDKNEKIISGLKENLQTRTSRVCQRSRASKVLGGLGIAIVSTNKGVLTDKEARKLNVGGEVLAFVW